MKTVLVPHDPAWADAFRNEAHRIHDALGAGSVELHHIGSTAIPGILAKPIIDMLGIVADLDRFGDHDAAMRALGFEVMGAFGIEGRRYYRKSDAAGKRSHHLHVFERGSAHIDRHLAFRDYLRHHPDTAQEYSRVKAQAISAGASSWGAYGDAKEPFIDLTERRALDWARRQP